ncbi:MAG: hypothetical protein ACI4JN_12525 [Ruminococcus sp.]
MEKVNYKIIFNDTVKNGERYVFSFGNTKNISLKIEEGRAESDFSMWKRYIVDDFTSFKAKIFRDIYRKVYLLHAILYNKGITVDNIQILIDDELTCLDSNDEYFPYMFSMLNNGSLNLSNEWKNAIPQYLISSTKTKIQYDHKNCSLQSFLLSNAREYQTDRFLNLWTAMNSVYNTYALMFEEKNKLYCETLTKKKSSVYAIYKVDSACLSMMINKIYPDVFVKDSTLKSEEHAKAVKQMDRLLFKFDLNKLANLYEESLNNPDNISDADNPYHDMYDAAESIHIPLFAFLLIVYPYQLRCDYFHGSRVQPVIVAYNEPEMLAFCVVNYFLYRYLNDEIPQLFKCDEISDEFYERIKLVLENRRKK